MENLDNLGESKPNILVLTVTYNSELYISGLIQCLLKQDYPKFSIVVRDDCSSDDTVRIAQSALGERGKVLVNHRRKGRNWTINQSLPLSSDFDYIVILNASTRFDKDLISSLASFAESMGDSFGGATPQIYDACTLQPFVGRRTVGFSNLVRTFLSIPESNMKKFDFSGKPYIGVDSFWGCCCILKAELVNKLGFDEELVTYGDEPDFSYRATALGYRFYWTYCKESIYKTNTSTSDKKGLTPYAVYYGLRNRLILLLRYGSAFEILLIPFFIFFYAIQVFKRPKSLRSFLGALVYVISNLPLILQFRRIWRSKLKSAKT